jgi:hypothetical protein
MDLNPLNDKMDPQAQPTLTDAQREATHEAVAGALGEALDCTRMWSAWSVGTMRDDDFVSVAGDSDRVAEIADAAIAAMPVMQAQCAAPDKQSAFNTWFTAAAIAFKAYDRDYSWRVWQAARASIAAQPAKSEACPDPAACNVQGCINPKGRCEEATPAPAMGEELPPQEQIQRLAELHFYPDAETMDIRLHRFGRACMALRQPDADDELDHGETVLRVQKALGITDTGWVSPDVVLHYLGKAIERVPPATADAPVSQPAAAVDAYTLDAIAQACVAAGFGILQCQTLISAIKGELSDVQKSLITKASGQPAAPAQPVAAQGEPVHFYRHKGADHSFMETSAEHIKNLQEMNFPWEFRTLYTAPPPASVAVTAVAEGWKLVRINEAWDAIKDYSVAAMGYYDPHAFRDELTRLRKAFEKSQVALTKIIGIRIDTSGVKSDGAAPSAPVGGSDDTALSDSFWNAEMDILDSMKNEDPSPEGQP